jgi:uncharacterized protein YndB with AHSA1/START domain
MAEKVNVTKQINVPSAKVWDAISGIEGLDRWFPIIQTCKVEGEGVGATRFCGLGDGAELKENIEEINHAEKRFRYAITDSPLPISNHMGTVEVSDADGGGSVVSWTAEFDVVAEARDEIVGMLNGAFSDGISGIEADLK